MLSWANFKIFVFCRIVLFFSFSLSIKCIRESHISIIFILSIKIIFRMKHGTIIHYDIICINKDWHRLIAENWFIVKNNFWITDYFQNNFQKFFILKHVNRGCFLLFIKFNKTWKSNVNFFLVYYVYEIRKWQMYSCTLHNLCSRR